MEIKENLTTINYNSRTSRSITYIVMHYTGNSTDTAYNNTKYFKSVNRNASAHYFVDDNDIYRCVKDKDVAWHCGDKLKSGNGGSFNGKCTNYNSIGIEMCCTNYDISAKTEANAIELVKYLMKQYSIPATRVIRHYDVTNKICPKPMVNDTARWNNFKAKLGGTSTVSGTTSPKTPTCTGDITYQAYDNKKKQWLPEVINLNGYVGNLKNAVGGVRAKCKNGNIYMQAHIKGGKWLEEISSANYVKNSNDGNTFVGILGKNMDGIKIWSDYGYVSYRVHVTAVYNDKGQVVKKAKWLDWVHKADNTNEGFGGILGRTIDAIQMK